MSFDAEAQPYLSADLPGIGGRLRSSCADFEVEEIPLYEPTGTGTHLYVQVRREGANTRDLQRVLADLAGCRADEIGCAGLKDKHARCTQSFSIPRGTEETDEDLLGGLHAAHGFEVLAARRHANKLRTGHLVGNRFRIIVRELSPDAAPRATEIVRRLQQTGVPNWFGEQRFGNDAENAARGRAILLGARENRAWHRRFMLTAWQSEMFNQWLRRRLGSGELHRVARGDIAKKTATGGIFEVEDEAADQARFETREIVLTGPIYGGRLRQATGKPGEQERLILADSGVDEAILRRARLNGDRRRALIWPEDLMVEEVEPAALAFRFALPKGSFATTVLREIMKLDTDQR